MEIGKVEVAAVEEVVIGAEQQGISELFDCQLALVGGGIGEVIVA